MLLESGLSQHVSNPTRGENILDLVFSTNDGLLSNVDTVQNSAPATIQLSFNISLDVYKDNINKELIFVYCKGNFEKLKTNWQILIGE